MNSSKIMGLAIAAITGAAVLASPAQAQVGRNETGGVCLISGLLCPFLAYPEKDRPCTADKT